MDYFEVKERDGPGRTGELRMGGESAETPLLAEHTRAGVLLGEILLKESGTAYHPAVGDTAPDYPSPLRADERVLAELEERSTTAASPEHVAATVHGGEDVGLRRRAASALEGFPLLILGSAPALDASPRKLSNVVPAVREAARPDAAIYAPGLALPWSVPLLIYAGIDLLDDSAARIAAARNTYLERDRASPLEELEETVCPCPACLDGNPESFEGLLRHNRATLETEVRLSRAAVARGQLRELVEGRIRTKPWLVAALRHLDENRDYVEERTPTFRRSEMLACGEEALRRAEVTRFAERMHGRYEPPDADAAVILPCSAGKPYFTSRSHSKFRRATGDRALEIVLTSPMGAVPRELETVYPVAHYDVPVTGHWSEEEIAWMTTNLENLLGGREYGEIVAHVRDEGYVEAVKRVEENLGVEARYTSIDNHPTSDESLADLEEGLRGFRTDIDRYAEGTRCVADYMLGKGAGTALLDGAEVRGRYPSLRVERDGEVLATAVPAYGSLAFTLRARDVFPSDYVVEIEDFVPMGSVLAPGVVDAPEGIRPGDEVLVEGPSATCVGRARMSGDEMARSRRGVAVDVRHREEI